MPDCIVPVPMHRSRLRQRGFNQAAELAHWCARELDLMSLPDSAARIADTGSLASLSRAERQLCIRGAFSVDANLADQHVAIVDDVLTTGATSGELARELYDTGVAEVSLWVIARTPLSDGTSINMRFRASDKLTSSPAVDSFNIVSNSFVK